VSHRDIKAHMVHLCGLLRYGCDLDVVLSIWDNYYQTIEGIALLKRGRCNAVIVIGAVSLAFGVVAYQIQDSQLLIFSSGNQVLKFGASRLQ